MSLNPLPPGEDLSPWPPALQHTPEVQSGIYAAAALAFGPCWDTPMCELDTETLLDQILEFTPDLFEQLLGPISQEPAAA